MDYSDYQKDVVKKMKSLKVYKKEFEHTVNMLAKALADYEAMTASFEESGGKIIVEHTNQGGAANLSKNPFYATLEKLRADILLYSRELGLTPAALKKINEGEMKAKKESSFSAMLRDIGK